MKSLVLALMSVFSLQVYAAAETEFFNSYAQSNELIRAADAHAVCTDIMNAWPDRSYVTRLQNLGATIDANPEASYLLVSTCQGLWTATYLDPVKSTQIKRDFDRSKISYYIVGFDLLNSAKYLGEEIRLFLKLKPATYENAPPSPYELLSGLASSDRQLDESLNVEVRSVTAKLIAAGGMTAVQLQTTKGLFDLTRKRAVIAARAVKQALFIGILAIVAGESVDAMIWQSRYKDLNKNAELARRALTNATTRAIAAEEFKKSIERLGYFYTYGLYLKDNGEAGKPATDDICHERLRSYFQGQNHEVGSNFLYQQKCRDAANLWLDSSLYLQQNFSANDQIQSMASDLMTKAKRAFWAFEETKEYLNSLPVCTLHPTALIGPGASAKDCLTL